MLVQGCLWGGRSCHATHPVPSTWLVGLQRNQPGRVSSFCMTWERGNSGWAGRWGDRGRLSQS